MKKIIFFSILSVLTTLLVSDLYSSFNTSNALNNFGFNDMHNQGNYGFANDENDIYDQNNKKNIASYFMHKQADDLDVSDFSFDQEKNPLLQATIEGDFERVEYLLQKRVNPNSYNKDKITALHFAAVGNYGGIARLLLKYKADPNVQNKEGDTPLHIAAKESSFRVAQALMEYGAQLLKNNEDKTPFDCATNDRMRRIVSQK